MLTEEQLRVIEKCNENLKAVGLKTYTEMEEHGAMLGLAALESVEMGKVLFARLEAVEKQMRGLKGKP